MVLLPVYIVITIVFIVLFSILAINMHRDYLKNKNRKKLIFTSITIIIVIIATILEAFFIHALIDAVNHHIIEYSVELDSTSGEREIVYVPISANRNLQNSIEIVSGTGQIRIIESEHGICLEINFTDTIEVYGILDTRESIGNHDLTMVNQTVLWERIEYWIYYEPYNSSDYSCSLRLELIHNTFDWWETHNFDGFLDGDWNTYWARHEALS